MDMETFAILCSIAALAIALAGCSRTPASAPETHDAEVKAITDLEAAWDKAAGAKDIDKTVSYYADDAVLIAPGESPAQGKPAIDAMFHEMAKDPAFSLRFQTTKADVAKSGDVAYTWGAYQFTATDPDTHKRFDDHGSYATVYRKQADGSWKAEVDTISSALMPAAPSSPHK
jgi:uncharacterized protein (TIGR02246 family)